MVKHITTFDYEEFAKTGSDYLIKSSGKDVGGWQVKHSNIPLEQKRGQQLIDSGTWESRFPTIDDVKKLLGDGYLVECLINVRKLNGRDGYFGHAVVVKGYDDKHLIIHDPGSPAMPDRKVKYDDFEAAWADPDDNAKELSAIKLKA